MKYIQTTASAAFTDLSQYATKLNIYDFFADFSSEMRDEDTIVLCDDYYYQFIDKDFMEDDLNRFICLTILASRHFWEMRSQIDSIETTCAIHIRNGDFLEIDKYNCFDRAEYLSKAVSLFPGYVDKAVVFSDDIDLCRREYLGILGNRFSSVVFEPTND